MLAAEVWHWWIGVVLAGAGIAVAIALIASYLKNISAQKYPDGKQSAKADL